MKYQQAPHVRGDIQNANDQILNIVRWVVPLFFIFDAFRRHNLAPNNIPLGVLTVIIAYYLSIFTHELGHILGGLLVGMKPRLFAVSTFALYLTKSGWRVRFDANIGEAGGVAGFFSTRPNAPIWREFVGIAGAPIMDLFLGLLLAYFAFTINTPPTQLTWHGDLRFFLEVLGGFELASFVSVFRAKEFGGYMSDGLRLKRFFKGGVVIVQEMAVSNMSDAGLAGSRPRDWDKAWVETALAGSDGNIFDLHAHILAYYWSLDQNDIEKAREHLLVGLSNIERFTWTTRCEIWLEAAYFYARFDQNLESALEYFQLAVGNQCDTALNFRAEAAIRLLKGQLTEAISKTRGAIKALSLVQNPGVGLAEREWLETMLEEANKKLLETSAPENSVLEPLCVLPEPRRKYRWFATWVLLLSGLSLLRIPFPQNPEQFVFGIIFAPLLANLLLGFAFVVPGWFFGFKSVELAWLELFKPQAKNEIRMNQTRVSELVGSLLRTGADNDHDLVHRSRLVLLGGLLTIGVVGLGALQLSRLAVFESADLPVVIKAVSYGLSVLGWFFVLYALGSLVSLTGFDLFYTGYRLDVLRRGGFNAKRQAAHDAWVAAVTRGVRPRDWHSGWMQTIMQGEIQNASDLHDRMALYFWALDQGNVDLAAKYFDEAWQHSRFGSIKTDLKLEKSYFEAEYRNDPVTARQTLKKLGNYVTHQRAEAAVLYAEGQFVESAKTARKGLDAIYQADTGGIATSEAQWLGQIEQRALNAILEH